MKKFAVMIGLLVLFVAAASFAQIPSGAWYRGDLHSHSTYSDGDSPVAEVIAYAEARGFDFFTITDHDVFMSGNPLHWNDTSYHSSTMAILYGVEWTTPKGHANIWAAAPFDYSPLWRANRERNALSACNAAHANGALFSINHPESIFVSTWDYPVSDCIDSVEVWNGMYRFPSLNRWAGHNFWDKVLKSGRRITGVGGSDTHHIKKWQSVLLGQGNPTTWVFAAEKSAQAILAGIKAGHVSISYAPDAPRLEFIADATGDGVYDALMGDSVEEFSDDVSFRISVVNVNGKPASDRGEIIELGARTVENIASGRLRIDAILHTLSMKMTSCRHDIYAMGIFKNGTLFRAWLLIGAIDEIKFSDNPAPRTYYRVELRGKPAVTPLQQVLYGRVIAISNPIYFAYAQ